MLKFLSYKNIEIKLRVPMREYKGGSSSKTFRQGILFLEMLSVTGKDGHFAGVVRPLPGEKSIRYRRRKSEIE